MSDAYPLKPFRILSHDTLCEIMRLYPLATVISGPAGEAKITLLPLVINRDDSDQIYLLGHLDRNNDHAQMLEPGAPVSFQFLGPDSYASPDLYADSHLPGWLYVSVQGDGEVSDILDDSQLRKILITSTDIFGDEHQRFSLSDTDERIGNFLPGIKGFRIKVTRISGIGKLAQDKGQEDSRIAMEFLLKQNNLDSLPLLERILQETL
jgi:transcriptional regulator